MTVRWEITVECGEYDARFQDLENAIASFRSHLVSVDLKHTVHEERDGRPSVEKWAG